MARKDNLLNGMMLGAGLMYYLDPDRGRRRRAAVRDQFVHYTHKADDAMDTAARDLRNRTVGVAAEARSWISRDSAPVQVLEARVRSELGRLVSHPSAIQATADENGRVTLRGPVLADEHDQLISGVESVKGIKDVIDRLEVHRSADGVPGLQGIGRRPENRIDIMQENWAPATRLLAGTVGGMLLLRGIRGNWPGHSLLTLMGLGVLSRALTNLEINRIVGMDAGRRAIDVHKTITINAPIDEVFGFWSDYENFPRFMSHLKEVRHTEGNRSHWVAEGPAGLPFEWDAETVRVEENRLIAWRSVGTSPIQNTGIIQFQEDGPNATRIDVHLSYNPPAGAIGHAVASFLGTDPKRLMDEDLVRLKSLLEDGKTTAHHQPVMRDEVRRAIEEERGR